jgi:hypothetical protein
MLIVKNAVMFGLQERKTPKNAQNVKLGWIRLIGNPFFFILF